MIFTGIFCNDKDIQEVWWQDRIIWQRSRELRALGDAVSRTYEKAYIHLVKLDLVKGESDSTSYGHGFVKPIVIEVVAGDSVSYSFTDSQIQIIKVLTMAGVGESWSYMDSAGRNPMALLLNGRSEFKSADNANCIVIGVLPMSSAAAENSSAEGNAVIASAERIAGDIYHNFRTDGQGIAVYILPASADSRHKVNVRDAVAQALTESGVISSAKSKSDAGAVGRDNTAVLAGGGIIIEGQTAAVAKVLGALGLGGEGFSFFDTEGKAVANPVDWLAGRGNSVSDGLGNADKYRALVGRSKAESESDVTGTGVLWYPPVGDGVVLFPPEDITRDGTLIEIQQCYEVIVDEDNSIIELR